MAAKPLTTTYNELADLGACQDGLDTLLKWIRKIHLCSEYRFHPANEIPLTPADILESNGRAHLDWAIEHVPGWYESLEKFCRGNAGARPISAWAKSVSAKKVLAKDLKEGDKIRVAGVVKKVVVNSYDAPTFGFVQDGDLGGYREFFRAETLDAIGFTLIEPKREPRRLKAEQILVPENVGTKWRKGGAVAEVQRHQIDCSSVGFWRMDEGRWCNAFDNVIIGEWEEVLE